MQIELMQIEFTDISYYKEMMNSLYRTIGGSNKLLSYSEISLNNSDYNFSVKTSTPGDFKKKIIGFAFIKQIDWVSRHAELQILPQDYKNKDCCLRIVTKLMEFSFQELNLNKVWIESIGFDTLNEILPRLGFVLEGIRRKSKYKKGRWVDSHIYSLLSQEFK